MENFKPAYNLSNLERKILIAIRDASPQWLTRSEIAERMGNRQLNAYSISRLQKLISRGLIESRRPRWVSGNHKLIEYRAVIEIED